MWQRIYNDKIQIQPIIRNIEQGMVCCSLTALFPCCLLHPWRHELSSGGGMWHCCKWRWNITRDSLFHFITSSIITICHKSTSSRMATRWCKILVFQQCFIFSKCISSALCKSWCLTFKVDEDPPLGLGTSVVVCFGRAVDQCGWRVVRRWNSQWNSAQQGGMTAQQVQGRRGDHIVSPPTHSPAVELCSGGMGGNPWGESHIFPHTMDTLWTQTQILGKGSGHWPPTKLLSFFFYQLVWSSII